jgi:phenylpropionate dioxygenase-like ring-hydroxylating dioxygenase large terminal subunit
VTPDLVEDHRVHRRIYVDPEIFAEEMVRVFGGTWTYLVHESQLRRPGDYVSTQLGLRPVLVTRDQDGRVHGLLNRCRHRGVVLPADRCGTARRFTCPYHGWTYGADGALIAVPYPDSYGPGFDRGDHGLARVTVATYRGFVFGTLDPDAPDLADHLGAARPWLDAYVDRRPGGEDSIEVAGRPVVQRFRGNWKLSWDNATDGLHATFAHRSYNELGREASTDTVLARNPATTPMYGKALGNGHMVVDQRPGLPGGTWEAQREVPGSAENAHRLADRIGPDPAREALEHATGDMVNLCLFPNLLFVGNHLMVVRPVSVDETELELWLTQAPGAPVEIRSIRPRVEEDFTAFGTPDDIEMFERAQAGLAAVPEVEWVDASRGLGAGDHVDADGLPTGSIMSEAPTRGYLRRYRELMARDPKVTTW